jgi:signal transduction histidine kinase
MTGKGVLRQLLRIRTKVAAALTLPLVALFTIAGLEVAAVRRATQRAVDQAGMAMSIVGPDTLITALQVERNVVAFDLIGLDAAIVGTIGQDPVGATETTDARLAEFVRLVASRGDDVAAVYAPALATLDTLGGIRADALRFDGPRGFANTELSREIFGRYTALVEQIVAANARVARSLDELELRSGAALIDLSNRQEDLVARLVAEILFATLAQGGLDRPGDIVAVSQLLSRVRANEASLSGTARGDYAPATAEYLATDHIVRFPELVGDAVATGRPVLVDPVGGDGILDNADVQSDDVEAGGYTHTTFQEEVEAILRRHADDLRNDARRAQLHFAWFASFGLIAVAATTYLVSRSITRPLRALTDQASATANKRLPDAVRSVLDTPLGDDVAVPYIDPIRVSSRDEVADVADALNTVQQAALELAVEQAVLRRNIADSFANLGRRNQNLVGRQLDFITELEQGETDPDALADLFRLDHLATRMRRNAESLLVLAGIAPPRTWAAPVQVTEIIGAALGEVEDYRRVIVRAAGPAAVIGSAASDLAHLLAELIENALTFSPAGQAVEVHGRHRPRAYARHHPDGERGYELEVIDHGPGMPSATLARVNRRLAGVESFTVAPSKYLGHYVAGNLAARHGITVRLQLSPGFGITASVHVPPELLADDARDDADDSTSHVVHTRGGYR